MSKSQEISYTESTVLLTGATSGIGNAILHELGSRGARRFILIARSEDDLSDTRTNFEKKYPGSDLLAIPADLTNEDEIVRISEEVTRAGLQVDILVNDAGAASAGPFAGDVDGADPLTIVDLNVRAVVSLSNKYLPGMVSRGRGGILNVASTAGFIPVPYSAAYAASKAFILSLSKSLWVENSENGVRIACVVPGVTKTNLSGEGRGERRGFLENVSVSSPEEVAKVAIEAFDDNDPERIVGNANKVLQAGLNVLPETIVAKVIGNFTSDR